MSRRQTSTKAAAPSSTKANPANLLAGIVAFLSCFGLTMILSASSVTLLAETGSAWGEFRSQAMWLGIGFGVFIAAAVVDHRRLQMITMLSLIGSLVLLVLVLLPGLGVSVNGAQRWVRFGPVQFQPSEIAKLVLVLFVAHNLARTSSVDTRRSLRPILVVLAFYGGLILTQPNLGTTIIIFAIGVAMLFAGGARVWIVTTLVSLSALAATVLALAADYRRDRLLAFRDPWSDPLDTTYHTLQSLVSVANGGVRGVGIGASRGKYGYLPEAHNDFIFAVTAEEFGLVGSTVVVLLYLAFGLLSLWIARHADRYGALICVGIATWVVAQAFINIGGVLGALPITGVPLPFMSAGGSALVVTMFAAGVVVNIGRGIDWNAR